MKRSASDPRAGKTGVATLRVERSAHRTLNTDDPVATAAVFKALPRRARAVVAAQLGQPQALVAAGGIGTPEAVDISVVAAVASGLTLLLCWRFTGAGFGDVRLPVLGGLGLGHATHRGLLLALAALILIIVTQAMFTLLCGENRRTTMPFGPALTIGFLLAATV
jgi:leader peptidase (prepilin peptidase) / N-methyltransferase